MKKEIGISVDVMDRQVVVEFDRELRHIKFSPKQALEFAEAIANKVMDIDKKSPIARLS